MNKDREYATRLLDFHIDAKPVLMAMAALRLCYAYRDKTNRVIWESDTMYDLYVLHQCRIEELREQHGLL
jgi:hypothetical protein